MVEHAGLKAQLNVLGDRRDLVCTALPKRGEVTRHRRAQKGSQKGDPKKAKRAQKGSPRRAQKRRSYQAHKSPKGEPKEPKRGAQKRQSYQAQDGDKRDLHRERQLELCLHGRGSQAGGQGLVLPW